MIRIQLQIGGQSAVDSTFFCGGYENCDTGLYTGRNNLPCVPNRFCVGGTTIVGAANGLSLTVVKWGDSGGPYRADGGDNPLQRVLAFSVSTTNGH